jgi:hypothetical protein
VSEANIIYIGFVIYPTSHCVFWSTMLPLSNISPKVGWLMHPMIECFVYARDKAIQEKRNHADRKNELVGRLVDVSTLFDVRTKGFSCHPINYTTVCTSPGWRDQCIVESNAILLKILVLE